MITTTTPVGLGFNPFSVLKKVVTNPLVQQTAVAAGQAYAPGQYAQVTSVANRANALYKQAQGPHGPRGPMPMEPMPPPMMDPDIGPGGVKSSNGLVIAGVVAVGLIVLLMAK